MHWILILPDIRLIYKPDTGYPVRPETGCLCLDLLQLFLAKIVIHHNTYHKLVIYFVLLTTAPHINDMDPQPLFQQSLLAPWVSERWQRLYIVVTYLCTSPLVKCTLFNVLYVCVGD